MWFKILPTKAEVLAASGRQAKPTLVIPSLKVTSLNEKPNLNELVSYLLIRDGIPAENIYKARELYNELTHKLSNLGGLEKIACEPDLERFSKIIKKLIKIRDKGLSINKNITNQDAETLVELIIKIEKEEEEEKEKEINLKASTSLEQVLNTISDKIINILLQEVTIRGSFINIALALARLNPIFNVPDENDLRVYLKSKVLTADFKSCLFDSLKGNKVDKSKLTPLQKKFFRIANLIVWIIAHIPEFTVKYLPRVGKVTKLSVNIIQQIPIVGSLINTFLGPMDEAIRIFELHPREISLLRKEAKQLELLKKITDTVNKLKDESLGLVRKILP